MSRFGIWLYNALITNNISQRDLASRLGVAPRSVRRWIGTEIMPNRKTMKKIEDIFGMKMQFDEQNTTIRCKDCKHRGDPNKCFLAAISKEKNIPVFMLDNHGEWYCADRQPERT